MRPLLFTSIPPRKRGAGFAAPQLATIRSWLDAGFQPVSIHLAIELARHPGLRDALRVAAVDCVVLEIDAGDSDSALLCPIVDMLQAIRRRADESPCGIINADIRIAGPVEDGPVALLRKLDDDEFLISQRTDVGPGHAGGVREEVFSHGLDFLAMHPRWVDRAIDFVSPTLAFGRPWWDHYLPLALMACGARPRLLDPRRCCHDVHDNRWNWRHYCSVGKSARRDFSTAADRLDPPVLAGRWIDATRAEFGPFVPSRCVDVLGRLALHDAAPVFLTASFLKRQAAANMKLILRSAVAPAPPAVRCQR